MSAADLIASLDNSLADGEEFTLRRVVGSGSNVTNIDVTCLARIDAVSTEQIAAGIKATDLNVIFSPTQINRAQWPGGSVPQVPPFDVDQRVPRANSADKVILRGMSRDVTFSKPLFWGGDLVRLEMRVSG